MLVKSSYPYRHLFIVLSIVVLYFHLSTGCSIDTGPHSANEHSDSRPDLDDRIKFIESYLTFRREYVSLEYNVFYKNNSGRSLPAPSDWDIRLVAIVPSTTLNKWIISGKLIETMTTPDWVTETSRTIDTGSIKEWYKDGNREIGIDRTNNVVAYRIFTT